MSQDFVANFPLPPGFLGIDSGLLRGNIGGHRDGRRIRNGNPDLDDAVDVHRLRHIHIAGAGIRGERQKTSEHHRYAGKQRRRGRPEPGGRAGRGGRLAGGKEQGVPAEGGRLGRQAAQGVGDRR